MRLLLVVIGAALFVGVIGYLVNGARAPAQRETSEVQLRGVRIRASRHVLEQVRTSASSVGWTETRYDEEGGLVLTPPPNYQNDDFGRLLKGIDPYKEKIVGLQLLGPHGRPVDDHGIEQVDKR